jgi:hypothetical protein
MAIVCARPRGRLLTFTEQVFSLLNMCSGRYDSTARARFCEAASRAITAYQNRSEKAKGSGPRS